MLLVAVAAHNHTGLNIAQPCRGSSPDRSHEPTIQNFLDEILIVVRRCAVAGENAKSASAEAGKLEPRAMILVELRIGVAVRRTHPCGIGS